MAIDFYKLYNKEFYHKNQDESNVSSAECVLSIIVRVIPLVKSVVDVGCGSGTWLHVFKTLHKTEQIKGIDGAWIYRDFLLIPEEDFIEADLSKTFPKLDKKFDLAISLEVAEHLPATRAKEFIDYLTSLSDFVLFSAAIPFQGGTNHINEQWQDYWAELFEKRGYLPLDIVRPEVWNDEKVRIHYRQNTILYVQKHKVSELSSLCVPNGKQTLSVVHPNNYHKFANPSIKRLFWKGVFRRALKKFIRRIFSRLTK